MGIEKLVELKGVLLKTSVEVDSAGERRDWNYLNDAEQRKVKAEKAFYDACDREISLIYSEIIHLRKENARISGMEQRLIDAIGTWRDIGPRGYEDHIRFAIEFLGYDPDPEYGQDEEEEDES